jgi:hypothetical protein
VVEFDQRAISLTEEVDSFFDNPDAFALLTALQVVLKVRTRVMNLATLDRRVGTEGPRICPQKMAN